MDLGCGPCRAGGSRACRRQDQTRCCSQSTQSTLGQAWLSSKPAFSRPMAGSQPHKGNAFRVVVPHAAQAQFPGLPPQ
jgi:hypothetical protein